MATGNSTARTAKNCRNPNDSSEHFGSCVEVSSCCRHRHAQELYRRPRPGRRRGERPSPPQRQPRREGGGGGGYYGRDQSRASRGVRLPVRIPSCGGLTRLCAGLQLGVEERELLCKQVQFHSALEDVLISLAVL